MKKQLRLASIVAGMAIIASACASPTTSSAPSTAPESTAPESPAAGSAAPAALTGEVTLWHSYGSGGGETGALNTVLEKVRGDNPDLTINVVEQPFDQIFTKWRTEVAAGAGADMFIAPNDDLGKDAREESLMNLDEFLTGNAALDGYLPVALDGSKVDGSFYMVPESLKAVALWYDKSKVASPPTTSDELLAAVKDGSVKVGINQGVYHQFGWTGAFGGTLMDDAGKCTADAGGFADAFAYLKELKDAGATFNTDGNALKAAFQTGEINAIIDGPWQTADFRTALSDNLAVATIPKGPAAAANPFTGTDGWYINPNLETDQAQARGRRGARAHVARRDADLRRRRRPRPGEPDGPDHRPDHAGLRRRGRGRFAATAERTVRQLVGPVRRCAEQGHRHGRRPGHGRQGRLRADERGERPLGPSLERRGRWAASALVILFSPPRPPSPTRGRLVHGDRHCRVTPTQPGCQGPTKPAAVPLPGAGVRRHGGHHVLPAHLPGLDVVPRLRADQLPCPQPGPGRVRRARQLHPGRDLQAPDPQLRVRPAGAVQPVLGVQQRRRPRHHRRRSSQ